VQEERDGVRVWWVVWWVVVFVACGGGVCFLFGRGDGVQEDEVKGNGSGVDT